MTASTASKRCPTCGARLPLQFDFCEVDGTRLVEEQPEPQTSTGATCPCGHAQDDGDGYCAICGHRITMAAAAHETVELAPDLAGVTDRGKRHPANEDAIALAREATAQGPVTVLVVCDGLSSSDQSAEASRLAADTARDALLAEARAARIDAAAMTRSVRAAHDTVCLRLPDAHGLKDPAGTTIVAAVTHGRQVVVGWVGDSRAYWIGPGDARCLTRDHSWAEEMISQGKLTPAEAYQQPQAHAITQCLGPVETADGAPPPTPDTVQFDAPEGWLLLCSDGLWNYAMDVAQLRALVPFPFASARTTAESLVDYALDRGGHDNVSVILARLDERP